MNKVHARSQGSKRQARRVSKSGVNATDRRILEQAVREDAEGASAPESTVRGVAAPAAVLRNAKARMDAAVAMPIATNAEAKAAVAAHAAAERDIAQLQVPMTLNEICQIMGSDCRADEFPVSSIDSLADQLDAISQMADVGCEGGYERWLVVDNIVSRMRLASRVTAWMLTDDAAKAAQS
jgi:hypothetical protein